MWLEGIFINNTYAIKDYTYPDLHGTIQNKDILVVKGDKNSTIATMKI